MHSVELNIGSWDTPVIGGGWITANPIMTDVFLNKERSAESLFIVRVSLSQGLIFTGDEYIQLFALKEAGNLSVDIRISKSEVIKLEGLLMLYGEFDHNKKVSSLDVVSVDDYSEILKNTKTDVNVLESTINTCALTEESTLLIMDEYPCFDSALPVSDFQKKYDPNGDLSADPSNINPDWSNFILVGNDPSECPPGFTIYEYHTTYISFEIPGEYEEIDEDRFEGLYLKASLTTETAVRDDFTQFRLATDIIENILSQTDSSINFDINTYCDYFDNDYTNLEIMLVADKSDVLRPDASNKATFELTNFAAWMEYYKIMFGLEWLIDGGDFKFKRVDSFTSPVSGNDISDSIDNLNRFTTDVENKFSKETWKTEYSGNSQFIPSNLVYATYDENTQDYDLANINNDMVSMINDPDDYVDSGFVFVAATDEPSYYQIINKVGLINPHITYKNGELTPEQLVRQHNSIDRSYSAAEQDGVSVVLTKRPDNKYTFQNIDIFDIDDIDFDEFVITGFGNMIIDKLGVSLDGSDFAKIEGRT